MYWGLRVTCMHIGRLQATLHLNESHVSENSAGRGAGISTFHINSNNMW